MQDFNALKVKLENDRQSLEQHMETMLATYQLNIEKLDYNYRVLVERDHENTATINQQKRKIARQRDLLTGLKSRCDLLCVVCTVTCASETFRCFAFFRFDAFCKSQTCVCWTVLCIWFAYETVAGSCRAGITRRIASCTRRI